jgi:hypothetical protein
MPSATLRRYRGTAGRRQHPEPPFPRPGLFWRAMELVNQYSHQWRPSRLEMGPWGELLRNRIALRAARYDRFRAALAHDGWTR